MKSITSKDNPAYKAYSKLLSGKYRDSEGRYLVEGKKPVTEALAAGYPVEQVLLREGLEEEAWPPEDQTVFLEGRLFDRLAQTETSQGVIAVVKKPAYSRETFLAALSAKNGNVVVLDRLQDPGNIGAIIRTADAAGYSGVITIAGTGDVFSPKIVRAAAGSLFRVPILAGAAPREAIALLREAKKTVISTGVDTGTCYDQVAMTQNVALIIGNEGNGISGELMGMADINVTIPMAGSIDSLNASVAAGILMYESVRGQSAGLE